jgi:very-long-chain (3R)-3-hydroxyacyl-CoA dehydratase
LIFFQFLAISEIVFSITGLVRANFITTFIQVLSRIQVLLVVTLAGAHSSSGMTPMVFAWGLVETVRYSYLGLNLMGAAPFPLKWARYTFFYVLYPLGVYGEMKVIGDSLKFFESNFSISLPNSLNTSVSVHTYLLVLLYLVYLPGLYVQYTHMIKQRKNAFRPISKGE